MEQRTGYFPMEALDVSGGGKTTCFISAKLVLKMEDRGRTWQYYGLISASEVLANPSRIYQGLQRKGYENGLCYVGRPRRYGKDWDGPALPKKVFIACVTECQVLFEWGWEDADENDFESPENASTRFTTLKWKRS